MADNHTQATHLVIDYRPSQWTGWEWGKTIGGHHPAQEFKVSGRHYRISLLAFGRPGSSRDPVYEQVPGDPANRVQAHAGAEVRRRLLVPLPRRARRLK